MFLRKRKSLGVAPAEADRWLSIAPGVQVSADEDGLAVLDTSTGRVFADNPAAASIWLSASKGLTIQQAAEELSTRFGIARDRAERDIRAFVESMVRNGLAVRGAEKP